MAFRCWAAIALGLAAVACSEPEQPKAEPAKTEEWAVGNEKLGELQQVTPEEFARLRAQIDELMRQDPPLSAFDREILAEYESIRALFEQEPTAEVAATTPVSLGSFGLETRTHQLWFHTGTRPRLYTVKSKSGAVLAERIDDARLKQDYPELHELVHGAIDARGGDGRAIDY